MFMEILGEPADVILGGTTANDESILKVIIGYQ